MDNLDPEFGIRIRKICTILIRNPDTEFGYGIRIRNQDTESKYGIRIRSKTDNFWHKNSKFSKSIYFYDKNWNFISFQILTIFGAKIQNWIFLTKIRFFKIFIFIFVFFFSFRIFTIFGVKIQNCQNIDFFFWQKNSFF